MFRHVIFIGLLALINSYSTLAHEVNDKNYETSKNENPEFVYPLDPECANMSKVKIEDFKAGDSLVKNMESLCEGTKFSYLSCLAWKNQLLHPGGTVMDDNLQRAVNKELGSSRLKNFNEFAPSCFYSPLYEHQMIHETFCICASRSVLSAIITDEERNKISELESQGVEDSLSKALKEAFTRTVNALHGIVLQKP